MLSKLSDDELLKRLNDICTKLNWANTYSHSDGLRTQITNLRDQINFELSERQNKRQMEQLIKSQPAIRNISDNNIKVSVKDTTTTKKKYDGGRMLRSQTPSTPKDE